jgi:hypothetical protein
MEKLCENQVIKFTARLYNFNAIKKDKKEKESKEVS